jgi:hypothetical protein
VLAICDAYQFIVYSYDIDANIFLTLGIPEHGNDFTRIEDWISDTRAVVRAYEWGTNSYNEQYYVVDVDHPNNLEYIASGTGVTPIYTENPPHVEWMPSVYSYCDDGEYSSDWHIYDLMTRTLTLYPAVGGVTGLSFPLMDGTEDRLYRRVTDDGDELCGSAHSATLVRFNYGTGEWQDLMTGEIEWIDSVSPDGRYAVLIMGSDGEILSNNWLIEGGGDYRREFSTHLIVLDLNTISMVYEATSSVFHDYNNPFSPSGTARPLSLTWLDGNTFLIQYVDGIGDQVIQLGDEIEVLGEWRGLKEHRTSFILSPDKRHILLNYGNGQYSLFNLETGETMPITNASEYSPSVYWVDSDTLHLVVHIGPTHLTLASWLIDLPAQ